MWIAAPVLMSNTLIVCDAGVLAEPDLATVDALARLALAARRQGRRLRVRHACDDLEQLLHLAGFAGVVPCEGSAVETRG